MTRFLRAIDPADGNSCLVNIDVIAAVYPPNQENGKPRIFVEEGNGQRRVLYAVDGYGTIISHLCDL